MPRTIAVTRNRHGFVRLIRVSPHRRWQHCSVVHTFICVRWCTDLVIYVADRLPMCNYNGRFNGRKRQIQPVLRLGGMAAVTGVNGQCWLWLQPHFSSIPMLLSPPLTLCCPLFAGACSRASSSVYPPVRRRTSTQPHCNYGPSATIGLRFCSFVVGVFKRLWPKSAIIFCSSTANRSQSSGFSAGRRWLSGRPVDHRF